MLSRVAERLYWLARYLERAENTARLLNVFSQTILDLPKGAEPSWDTLLFVSASEEAFHQRYQNVNERNVAKFLLADDDNPVSILNSVRAARENARTTREILPFEVWEMINELYLDLKTNAQQSLARVPRYEMLQRVVRSCLEITGLLEGALVRGMVRHFIILGCYLERTDMSSRVLDVGAAMLLQHPKERVAAYEGLLWRHQLKSLNAQHAYRTTMGPRVEAPLVIKFLIDNPSFPRALGGCLAALRNTIENLPRPAAPLRALDAAQRRIRGYQPDVVDEVEDYDEPVEPMDADELHHFLDQIQSDLITIHETFDATWFLSGD